MPVFVFFLDPVLVIFGNYKLPGLHLHQYVFSSHHHSRLVVSSVICTFSSSFMSSFMTFFIATQKILEKCEFRLRIFLSCGVALHNLPFGIISLGFRVVAFFETSEIITALTCHHRICFGESPLGNGSITRCSGVPAASILEKTHGQLITRVNFSCGYFIGVRIIGVTESFFALFSKGMH